MLHPFSILRDHWINVELIIARVHIVRLWSDHISLSIWVII